MEPRFFFFLAIFGQYVRTEKVISSHTGTVGAGNYSYYSLSEKGIVTLILESEIGDADIYVSETVKYPSYLEYDLQSVTCGTDIVTVPESFKRPTHIGIYGHVSAPISKYKITAITEFDGSYHKYRDETSYNQEETLVTDETEETHSLKSVLWSLVIGLLKIIVEVMF